MVSYNAEHVGVWLEICGNGPEFHADLRGTLYRGSVRKNVLISGFVCPVQKRMEDLHKVCVRDTAGGNGEHHQGKRKGKGFRVGDGGAPTSSAKAEG